MRNSWRGVAWLSLSCLAISQNLPDGPGKDLFAKVCSECHALDLATNQKFNRAAWKMTVDTMASRGATATPEEFEMIVSYLAKNFGAETTPAKEMPDGAGKPSILRECTLCHLPDHFTKFQHTNEEWQAIIVRMGQRVKSATREELDLVQKYFATNYPKLEDTSKLNVNRATAKDLVERLSLTPEEGEAVVKYRQLHGVFKEWGELLAIYGVDGFKIEAAKDRMSF